MDYLVIVESPAKTSKIKDYLNKLNVGNFSVMASMGHIYELDGLKSIEIDNHFNPKFTIDKHKLKNLLDIKSKASSVDEVIIATDPDREGEGIGFNLVDYLKLNPSTTKRLRFFEITPAGIKKAWDSIDFLDINLYNAQKTRRILDLLVGFSISPLLWCLGPSLSAGRCQSPTLHLIRSREDSVLSQSNTTYLSISASFNCSGFDLPAYVNHKFQKDNLEIISNHLNLMVGKKYTLTKGNSKITNKNPPPPFITSTIQQELSSKIGLNPKSSMMVLQKLYEAGKITYMRTDSPSISDTGSFMIRDYIIETFDPDKYQFRKYDSVSKNAQEAHECIRPTDIFITSLPSFDDLHNRVYKIIHNRTVASLMTPWKEEKLQILYSIPSDLSLEPLEMEKLDFNYESEFTKTLDLGWYSVYTDEIKDEITQILELLEKPEENKAIYVIGNCNELLDRKTGRYTQASIIAELEKMGIGRPSTYSNIINTIQERKYVETDSRSGEEIELISLQKIIKKELVQTSKMVSTQNEKNKLFLTPLGKIVDDYLKENFNILLDSKFTADMEDDLDKISRGELIWYETIQKVYDTICKPALDRFKEKNNEKNKDKDKDKSHEREIGTLNDKKIFLNKGIYGFYLEYEKTKIKCDEDITEEKAIELINERKTYEDKTIIREWANVKILNGPYGHYIVKGKKKVSLPPDTDIKKLTLSQIDTIIQEAETKKKLYAKKSYARKYIKKS